MNALPPIELFDKKQYLYIWLDILGFSDILDKEDRYQELIDLLKYYRKKFEQIGTTTKTLTISDGIVLIFELESNSEVIYNIFKDIAKIQEEFILEKKYFLRGGMAIGTIEEAEENSDLKYLISNGLSKAYNLESKDIGYPIIGTTEVELKKLREYFNIDSDLEYFGLLKSYGIKSSTNNENHVYFIDFMNDKRFENIINYNLKRYESSPKVLEKYIWLYRYYNDKFSVEEDRKLGGIIL